MADPLSVIGVGLGVASLFLQVTDECIKGYKYFTEASQMAQCYQYLQIRLEIEQQRFLTFASQVGPLSKDGQVCAALQVNPRLLVAVLLEVKTVFKKLEESDAKYGNIVNRPRIDWNDNNEPQTDLVDMLHLPYPELPEKDGRSDSALKGVRRIGHRILETARRLKIVLEDPKRLVWVRVDKEAFEALVTKLSDLNSFLIAILNISETRRMVRIVEKNNWEILQLRQSLTNLDTLVKRLNREHKGHITSEEYAALYGQNLLASIEGEKYDELESWSHKGLETEKFRRIKSRYHENEVSQGSRKKFTTLMLDISEFSFPNTAGNGGYSGGRIIASWEKHNVLIEWMNLSPRAGKEHMETLRETRLSHLTETLHGDLSSTFGSPRCLGYVKSRNDNAELRFGMVFETPQNESSALQPLTLRRLFDRIPKPSLSTRLSLCSSLADFISSFHSSGWLHKSLKSDNVLFFGTRGTESSLCTPYVTGFDLSRPSSNMEMTEELVIDPWSDIYRHPHAQFGEAKNLYRRSYDIYSFGVILIEIALWEPIEDILGIENLADVKQRSLRGIYNQLLGKSDHLGEVVSGNSAYLANAANECGDAYREIVEICLEATSVERPAYRGEPKHAINSKIQVIFEQVTERLRWMKAALS